MRMCFPAAFAFIALLSGGANSEEGFWPFDMVPKERIARRFEFNVTDEWLDKARRAAVRVAVGQGGGGSASFVSPHGLAMTNRHVAGTALGALSVPGKTDLIRDGFFAKTQADELKTENYRLEQLIEIVNVNAKVRAEAERSKVGEDAALQTVAQEASQGLPRQGLKIQAVKLYPEGEYRLYKFKVYSDVRLVFAADISSGYFGLDQDNFTYPRHDFDVAFFRAYENGKPAATPDYYPWSRDGAKENELVFFAGNPGSTERSITLANLELERDKILPADIAVFARELDILRRHAALGATQAQAVQARQNQIENQLKRLRGQFDGLRDPSVFVRKKEEEDAAARAISDPVKAKAYADALAEMRRAVERVAPDEIELRLTASPWGVNSAQLFTAMAIAAGEERGRINFRNAANLQARQEDTFLYDPRNRRESERKFLEETFVFAQTQLGADHALTKLLLDGKTPAERAAELTANTKFGSAEFYAAAVRDGFPGVDQSLDPTLLLAKKLLRRRLEMLQRQKEFNDVSNRCYATIAHALAQAPGARRSPDGNFTPRLSFGTVLGYEDHGEILRPFTCVGRMFALCDRAGNREPYHLNDNWLSGRAKLNPCTPFNFVTDADGFGGNSGSPVFNRNREVVGLLFDGNYPGLVGKYVFDENTKRSVCVDSRAIVEVLNGVYGATELVKEFTR